MSENKMSNKIHSLSSDIKRLYNNLKRLNSNQKSFVKISSSLIDNVYDGLELFQTTAYTLDRTLYERFNKFLSSSNIEEKLMIVKHTNNSNPFDTYSNKENIKDIKQLLIAVAQFEKLLHSLNQMCIASENQDEIFTPNNINKDVVIQQIDLAINEIENSVIRTEEQKQIVLYLKETKTEIAKEKPSWKKVIGGIVIAAAIISAIADADKAIDNLNKAYTHIIGKSITQSVPSVLNPINPIDFSNHTIEYNDTKQILG